MKISTKGRYALRLMLDLAEHQKDGYIALKDIAERENLSKKYLEQIVPLLNRAGVLQTNRGFQGGYRLTKSPAEYTVGEILDITEGSLTPIPCLRPGHATCPRQDSCPTLPVWQGLDKVIRDYLDGITLQTLIDQQAERRTETAE